MQYQMSGASAPSLAPPPLPSIAAPEIVRVAPKRPRRNSRWILVVVVAALAGLGYWARQSWTKKPAQAGAVTIPVATISSGPVVRTFRLSGTTGAERFSSLMVPQMRGSRGDRGRDSSSSSPSSSSGSAAMNKIVQSNAGGSTNSSSGSTAAGGSATSGSSAGDGSSVASTSGMPSSGGSGAMRSATSRVGRTSAGNARSTPSNSRSAAGSSTGTENMGSTAGSLMSGGGGGSTGGGGSSRGGGSSEFGMVLQTAVKPGLKVRKGQVVAEFDRQYMLLRLDDYRASVTQMESNVKKLRAELEVEKKAHEQTILNAKATLDRARLDLKTIPVLGKIDAERTKLAAEEAEARHKQLLAEVKFVEAGQRAQLKTSELELEQVKLELKRAEANADRMLMKAGIDGLAVMQTTFRGTEFAQIQPGDQLWPGMMFMQIVDTSSMIVNATVNQVDVDNLKIGAKATVRFDAYPGLALPGHIYSIGAMTKAGGMRATFVKEIPVQLKLDAMDPRVIPDLSVSADVVLDTEEKATVAPLSSIFQDNASGAPYVFVKKGESWERREVQLGVVNNTSAAVRSGLRAGEVVATERPPEDFNRST